MEVLKHIRPLRGLENIRLLLMQPGVPHLVTEMAQMAELRPASVRHVDESSAEQYGLSVVRRFRDTGDAMDDEAIELVRQRTREVEEELRNARAAGDSRRVSILEEEEADCERLLKRAYFPSREGSKLGRKRKLGDPVEKARRRVRERILYAIKEIRDEHPTLAQHLTLHIKFGRCCSYACPSPIQWVCNQPMF